MRILVMSITFLLVLSITVLAQGEGLVWSSFIGGSNWDFVRDVVVLSDGNIAFVGETRSTDFPVTPDAFDHTHGNPDSFDGFFAICDPTGSELLYCTFIGGSEEEIDLELCQMPDGRVLVGGSTASSDFPVTGNAYQLDFAGNRDLFLVLFDVNTMSVVWSTYYGTATHERLKCLKPTDNGDLVLGYSFWLGDTTGLWVRRVSIPEFEELWTFSFTSWGNYIGIDVD